MKRIRVSARIDGSIVGKSWGGFRARLTVSIDLNRIRSLRYYKGNPVGLALTEHSGDFETAKFSSDTLLVLTTETHEGRVFTVREKCYGLAEFPSLHKHLELEEAYA